MYADAHTKGACFRIRRCLSRCSIRCIMPGSSALRHRCRRRSFLQFFDGRIPRRASPDRRQGERAGPQRRNGPLTEDRALAVVAALIQYAMQAEVLLDHVNPTPVVVLALEREGADDIAALALDAAVREAQPQRTHRLTAIHFLLPLTAPRPGRIHDARPLSIAGGAAVLARLRAAVQHVRLGADQDALIAAA